jgi:hypothetical protein
MTNEGATPPRLIEMLLHSALPESDAETVAGDLLEEYRLVKQPALGSLRADLWYLRHVLSIVGRLALPFAVALIAARIVLAAWMLFPLGGRWNPSLIPAPNVALLDAIFCVAAGYAGSRRTGRLMTGVVNAGVVGLLDFALFTMCAAWLVPGLPVAIARKPFILVIGATFLAIAMTFALVLGAAGAAGPVMLARCRHRSVP